MLMGTTNRRNHIYDYYRNHWHHKHKGFTATDGGAGQSIVKVTNLNASGAGSFAEALNGSNRIIVFDVGGTIDMNWVELVAWKRSNVTIAGQTAPPPGIKIRRGFLRLHGCSDYIVSHLDFFNGAGSGTGTGDGDFDGIQTENNANNIIIDHCSCFWGWDECLSVSGAPETTPSGDLELLRARVSHQVTVSQCVMAEPMYGSGRPGYGSAITDAVSDIFFYGNYWVNCYTRTPMLKGGAQAALANNLTYNAGQKAIEAALAGSWYDTWGFADPYPTGDIAAVGNVVRAGPSTTSLTALVMTVNNDNTDTATMNVYAADNDVRNYAGTTISTVAVEANSPYNNHEYAIVGSAGLWPSGFVAMPASGVWAALIKPHVGGRPWNRDAHVTRVLDHYDDLEGAHIATEATVGGYATYDSTSKTFVNADWDLVNMIPLRRKALVA